MPLLAQHTAVRIADVALEPLDAGEGAPATGVRALATLGGLEIGVWEMAVGEAVDTEAEEVFVVVAGRGRVEIAGDVIELEPGVIVRLAEGARSRWTVTETLRKVYLTAG
ncbi:DUF861 domain-containing protein [Rathayibacter sp. VKM Ac-2803]|uniref:cupin domain-containing protein n=1 Tax=unclassified Rathayibacter TaxID=2609250 RepID=UPI00135A44A5|nr:MULTISPECIES: cupin domain-containing protein [unclassified Rathayibacter]MWV51171.1 DUF861 domain-containing protein [Rathayibacter sp. VKM Ac-2803]MWV57656.1 DUF861 domain-containing protein [Rathayibacter sp. VKM Ac-2754]